MYENYQNYYTNDQAPQQPQQPKKEGALTRRMAILIMCGGVAASSVLGFGGGMLAANLGAGESDLTAAATSASASLLSSTSSSSSGGAMSVAQVVQSVSDSVVEVTTEITGTDQWMRQYSGTGAGSGVIISQDGYIVTNNHVVEDANSINIRLKDGTSYPARLVGTDAQTDLAVLKIEAMGLNAAVMGSSSDLQVGDEAIAIGNPLGELGGTVTNGIISALNREITVEGETHTVIQTNAAINQGNSGGGLFNNSGELVGIVSAKSAGTGIEGLGYAIPIDLAKPVIDDLITNGYVTGRGYLGVSTIDIDDAQTAFYYRVPQMGVYIASVENGSAAQRGGLQAGDCVLAVGDTQIESAAGLKTAVEGYSAGETVEVRVLRDGQELTLSVTLDEKVPEDVKQPTTREA